ncbi:MAG: single-stranded-DNA-specific exonuclease RecJ [bacterium]|nr:single-stranded-DNA-specific exonuclease RecJ [bacterium]
MKNWKILAKAKSGDITKILLKSRGIRTKKEVEDFFNPSLSSVSPSSVLISKKELKKAVKRISLAIKNKEGIVIFGDFDTDGICATAILWETIYQKYKNVFPYIPKRKEEGYGLSIEGIKNVLSLYPKTKLIITVDNGIVANKPVEFANKNKIDVIITDHHQKSKKLPKAFAIVHTDQVCGAGVAYLLAQNIKNLKNSGDSSVALLPQNDIKDDHLELVALATVADMVPLIGANRTLLKFGLEKLKKTKRMGLLELFDEAGIKSEEVGVYEIGHMIAPRLNATGRLSHAMDSLRLVCAINKEKAKEFALFLGKINKERQEVTEQTANHAKSKSFSVESFSKIVFVSSKNYDQGVIGLVASRLVDEYYKPSFVISVGEKYSKGSARSIRGVNIIEMIRSVSNFVVECGGHPMAAGFTVETEKIEEFKEELEKKADEIISDDLLQKTIVIDMPLNFENIDFDLYRKMQAFSPFGIGNPQPTFLSKNVVVEDLRLVGMNGRHVKFNLGTRTSGIKFDAIGFGMGDFVRKNIHLGDKIDVVYNIDENVWNGNSSLQLKIKDLRLN